MFLLFSNLDKIVETGIETAGSSALGSRVEVGSVAIDLTSGAASIYNFSVANPTGYSNAEMISFDELSVAIDLQNTNSQNVHVTSIVARSPHVLYEASGGVANLDKVSERFDDGSSAAEPQGADSANINIVIVIDSVLIENIQGTLMSDRLPSAVEVSLGDVRLNNLEGDPEELAQQIMAPVISQIGTAAAQALAQSITELLENAEAINEQVQDARDQIDDVTNQASEALESVGNLFKRD